MPKNGRDVQISSGSGKRKRTKEGDNTWVGEEEGFGGGEELEAGPESRHGWVDGLISLSQLREEGHMNPSQVVLITILFLLCLFMKMLNNNFGVYKNKTNDVKHIIFMFSGRLSIIILNISCFFK